MYVFGGSDGKKFFNEIYALNIKTWEWSEIQPSNAIAPRAGATSAVYKDQFLVFGGEGGSGYIKNENLSAYNVSTNSWSTLGNRENLPHARTGGILSISEKKHQAFLVGGLGGPADDVVTIFTLDLKEMALVDVSTKPGDFGSSSSASSSTPSVQLRKREEASQPAAAPESTPAPASPAPAKQTFEPPLSPRAALASTEDDRSSELARFVIFNLFSVSHFSQRVDWSCCLFC